MFWTVATNLYGLKIPCFLTADQHIISPDGLQVVIMMQRMLHRNLILGHSIISSDFVELTVALGFLL